MDKLVQSKLLIKLEHLIHSGHLESALITSSEVTGGTSPIFMYFTKSTKEARGLYGYHLQ